MYRRHRRKHNNAHFSVRCINASCSQIRTGIVGTDGVKPYNILILFFSLAYMAITLDITGILQSAAFWVSNMGGSNGYKLYFYFYLMLTSLSVMLGNDPVILSGTAFLVYYTKVQELDPISWLMSEFAAANTASMVLFVGNPTNVVVCEGFRINNVAFTAYTILPFLACNLACLVVLAIQFRDEKYIPRRLAVSQDLDVRSVLLDPIGALVGSIILGTCLITIIVVSFFHIDVWKISLPFAVTKFIYDFAWDHYRYTHGMLKFQKRTNSNDTVRPENAAEEIILDQLQRHRSPSYRQATLRDDDATLTQSRPNSFAVKQQRPTTTITPAPTITDEPEPITIDTANLPTHSQPPSPKTHSLLAHYHTLLSHTSTHLHAHFPTFFTALPRLPFALVPFAFSQFILIEALAHQSWITRFAAWLVRATALKPYPTILLVGTLGVLLCNVAGTNIGCTILLTKVVRAAGYNAAGERGAAVALAVATNIGAVGFTFSASLAGLLWCAILKQKGIEVKQTRFAYWNLRPLVAMTAVGLAVVCAEMTVLYKY